MEIQRWLTHTLAFHWPDTENTNEGFLCVCGEIFVQEASMDKWDPGIIQFSEHLKEMNAPPAALDLFSRSKTPEEIHAEAHEAFRGFKGDKPEKPPGDDPRAGHAIVTPNGWRRWFGLK